MNRETKHTQEPKKTEAGKEILKEIVLPSGKRAAFLKRRGIAIVNAQRKIGGDASRMSFALISEMVEIDGSPVLMEQLEDEIDFFDCLALTEEFSQLGKPGPMPGS
uniref:Phage tail assembly chaperone protein, E, or 41 or 14 n=1 Tax=Candidatus Kentrum sp. LFY TaxID=2126342 RepID=A0A450WGT0_9GAMM|nr:MAG: hypothetical protein BECKLFY1418C_GA0070996_102231 [Candidatus Kentron sp. LFY]